MTPWTGQIGFLTILFKAWFFFSATQKEVAIGIFADHGFTGHRIGEKQSACGYRLFDYGLQLKFIESNVPFWKTFAPIDTSFLGVFSQDFAVFS
jgi:hypothetical protein